MLVLTRKTQEQIHIGHNITVTVVRVQGHSVRLGIEAPESVRIVRGELVATMAEFRGDPPAEEGELAGSELEESAREPKATLLSPDDEDEKPTRGTKTTDRPLPSGRTAGGRACQLRRPPRLGPSSCRRLLCG